MKKFLLFLSILGNTLIGRGQTYTSNSKLSYDDWETVYEDDFNYTSISDINNKWQTNFFDWGHCRAYPNNTNTTKPTDIAEYYDGINAMSLQNINRTTVLNIQADKIPFTCSETGDIYSFRSGMIRSKYADNSAAPSYNDNGFLYGMFEIRCKIPNKGCMTPSFWLTGAHTWPPEIDVFEVDCDDRSKIYTSVHDGANNANTCAVHYQADQQDYFALDFHTWTCIWSPTHITFYLDGSELHTVTTPYGGHSYWNAMELIANLGVHSNQNGNYPADFQIDYIKVLKPKSTINLDNVAPTDVSGNIVWNDSGNRLFYKNTSNRISSSYLSASGLNASPSWIHGVLCPQAPANVAGDLVWSKNRNALFYKGTDSRLYVIFWNTWNAPNTPYWDYDVVQWQAPANVAGELEWSESRACLFYKDINNKISYVYWDPNTSPTAPHWQYGGVLQTQAPANVSGELTWSETRNCLFYKGLDNKIWHIFWNTWITPSMPYWDFGIVQWQAPANVAGELEWSENRACLFYKDTNSKISHLYWDSWSQPTAFWNYGELAFNPSKDINIFNVLDGSGAVVNDNNLVTGDLKWNDDANSLFFVGPKRKIYRIFWQNNKWNIQSIKWKGQSDEVFSYTDVSYDSNVEISNSKNLIFYKSTSNKIGISHWVNFRSLDPSCNNGDNPTILHIDTPNSSRITRGINNADSHIAIAHEDPTVEVPSDATVLDVKVFDFSAKIIKQFNQIPKNSLTNSLVNLPKGLYIIRYKYKAQWFTNKYYKTE